jgi:hypothetical protein
MEQKKDLVLMLIGAFLFVLAFYFLNVGKVSLRGTIFDSESPIFYFVVIADLILATLCFGFEAYSLKYQSTLVNGIGRHYWF